MAVCFMQMIWILRAPKLPKNSSQGKGMSPPCSRAQSRWQSQEEECFGEETLSRDLPKCWLRWAPQSRATWYWARQSRTSPWPCQPLLGAKAAGQQEFLCCGQWLLSKSWNTARSSAMAVLLQQVLLGSSRCYKSERNLFSEWGGASH